MFTASACACRAVNNNACVAPMGCYLNDAISRAGGFVTSRLGGGGPHQSWKSGSSCMPRPCQASHCTGCGKECHNPKSIHPPPKPACVCGMPQQYCPPGRCHACNLKGHLLRPSGIFVPEWTFRNAFSRTSMAAGAGPVEAEPSLAEPEAAAGPGELGSAPEDAGWVCVPAVSHNAFLSAALVVPRACPSTAALAAADLQARSVCTSQGRGRRPRRAGAA